MVRYRQVVKRKEGTSRAKTAKYKVRLVAKDYSQIPSVNITDVSVKDRSIQALFRVVVEDDLKLEHMDVRTTFLHEELQETIYM